MAELNPFNFMATKVFFLNKDKISPYKIPWRPRGGVDLWLYSFFNIGAGSGWVVNATPQPLYARERPDAHCIGGWVGCRVVLDGAENLAPSGFELWTVQPIAIPYTVYDIPALFSVYEGIFLNSWVATNLDTTYIKWKHNHSIVLISFMIHVLKYWRNWYKLWWWSLHWNSFS
jgi:hypothetical protein